MFTCNGFTFPTLAEAEAFQAKCQASPYDGQRHHIWSPDTIHCVVDGCQHYGAFQGPFCIAHLSRVALCTPNGYVGTDGRALLFCGSIANPAGFCCEHGTAVSPDEPCEVCGETSCGGCYVDEDGDFDLIDGAVLPSGGTSYQPATFTLAPPEDEGTSRDDVPTPASVASELNDLADNCRTLAFRSGAAKAKQLKAAADAYDAAAVMVRSIDGAK